MVSGSRNALLRPDIATPDNALAPSPTWADAAQWHGQNLADTWTALQNPQTWLQAARQYGVFDANTIDILRKYGIAGLIAGGGAAAAGGVDPQLGSGQ